MRFLRFEHKPSAKHFIPHNYVLFINIFAGSLVNLRHLRNLKNKHYVFELCAVGFPFAGLSFKGYGLPLEVLNLKTALGLHYYYYYYYYYYYDYYCYYYY